MISFSAISTASISTVSIIARFIMLLPLLIMRIPMQSHVPVNLVF